MTDLASAAQFIAAHARLIDRRRFAVVDGDGSADNVLRALAAHRNDDGGIGHLEPDLRTPASQPVCVLYALDIMREVEATDAALATGALDWLQTVTLDDGACRSCSRPHRAGRTRRGTRYLGVARRRDGRRTAHAERLRPPAVEDVLAVDLVRRRLLVDEAELLHHAA